MRTLLLLGALAFTACTTTGGRMQRVDELKPGISTVKDARAILGAPLAKGKSSDGLQIYRWEYMKQTGTGYYITHERVEFVLSFDAAGRFIRSEVEREPIMVTKER